MAEAARAGKAETETTKDSNEIPYFVLRARSI